MNHAMVLAVAIGLATAAVGETWTVDDDWVADFYSIQDAIIAASDGDVIIVEPGVYGPFAMYGKKVRLVANGATGETVIDAGGSTYAVICGSSATAETIIDGFTITGCSGSSSFETGAVRCTKGSSPSLIRCRIVDNSTGLGSSALYCDSSSRPTLTDTIVCGNSLDQLSGPWIDGGGNCISFECTDSDADGVPDTCQGPTDDGVHEVPNEFSSVQSAIFAAGEGDTVLVGPGTWYGYGDWVINSGGRSLTIRSTEGSSATVLDGNGLRTVVRSATGGVANLVIEGFTITGGSSAAGAGVFCSFGSVTLIDCLIEGNTANGSGGGVYGNDSAITMQGCTVTSNQASSGGGGLMLEGASGTASLSGCTISENSAVDGGGIYCANGSLALDGCMIQQNDVSSSNPHGGGLYCYNSNSILNDCSFIGNTALGGSNLSANGGGVFFDVGSSSMMSGCMIGNNQAKSAGGIGCSGSEVVMSNCGVYSNSTSDLGLGGGFHATDSSVLTLTDCAIFNNTSDFGGGLYIADGYTILDMVGCTISDNSVLNVGGGVAYRGLNNNNLTLTDCTLSDNTAHTGGGCYGRFTLNECTVRGNSATFGGGCYGRIHLNGCLIQGNEAAVVGGGVCTDGWSFVTDCVFDGNSSSSAGGGLYCMLDAVTAVDCVFSNNTSKYGGGVYINGFNESSVLMRTCTISANAATEDGGGIGGVRSSLELQDCTITGNVASYHGGGMYVAGGSPVLSDTQICGNEPDQINSWGSFDDQGGNIVLDECPACPGDFHSDGQVGILDLLELLKNWQGSGIGDMDGNGTVDMEDLTSLIDSWGPCE
jgi:hypothetical protein